MNRSMVKKLVSVGFAAVLSVGVMLPASASAATPSVSQETIQTLQQKLQQYLESQGWTGSFNCIVQKPVTKPEPEKPSTPEVEKPSTPAPPTSQPNEPSKPSQPSKPNEQPSEPSKPNQQPSEPSKPNQPSEENASFANQVVTLVNKERAKAGLKALTVHEKLTGMALDKAKDMHDNKYFDHTSPTYGSPFDMMKKYGISYGYAGENIAMGQRTPEEVMNSWMNSDGHRKNILSPNFTKIGVGYYNGYWVQEFISE